MQIIFRSFYRRSTGIQETRTKSWLHVIISQDWENFVIVIGDTWMVRNVLTSNALITTWKIIEHRIRNTRVSSELCLFLLSIKKWLHRKFIHLPLPKKFFCNIFSSIYQLRNIYIYIHNLTKIKFLFQYIYIHDDSNVIFSIYSQMLVIYKEKNEKRILWFFRTSLISTREVSLCFL